MTTNREKLRCVQRELKMRKRVYPRWTEKGRMSVSEADYEIRTMEAIEEDYSMLVKSEPPVENGTVALPGQKDLFSGEKLP